MKKKIFILGGILFCCSGICLIQAGGGKVSSVVVGDYAVVKSIGIGSPLSGRGTAPLVGLGLPYTGKVKTAGGGRRAVPAAVARPKTVDISSEFVLGEVYVYPNPAKRGQVPTFHIECGIADSVKITVYNVAGEVAHSFTIAGLPSAINDGHGLEYAYEYSWRGHIPSGVYYYAIEAQKTGKRLRKTGKLAVVR